VPALHENHPLAQKVGRLHKKLDLAAITAISG
jgi:hypothetical protein